MRTINVLATQRISADDRAKIEASDPEIRLIDAGGWFDGEIRENWTAFAAARYLPPGATGSGGRLRLVGVKLNGRYKRRRRLIMYLILNAINGHYLGNLTLNCAPRTEQVIAAVAYANRRRSPV